MTEEEFETGDMFHDPDGFYPEEKPPTFADHQMLSGQTVRVRLVGSHPLYVRHRDMQDLQMIQSGLTTDHLSTGELTMERRPHQRTLHRRADRRAHPG